MIITLIPLQVVKRLGQNKVHLPAEMFSGAMIVLLCQLLKINVVNVVPGTNLFNGFALYSLFLFAYGLRPRWLHSVFALLLLYYVGSSTFFSFGQDMCRLPFFQRRLQINHALLDGARNIHI